MMIQDIKLSKRCVDCGKKFSLVHKHHFRCEKCWIEYQELLARKEVNNLFKEAKVKHKFYSERDRVEIIKQKEFKKMLDA